MTFYPVDNILSLLPSVKKNGIPNIIALDGGGGSGKSTLARELALADSKITLLSIDDFFLPVVKDILLTRSPQDDYEFCCDKMRLKSQVFEPLRVGKPLKYQSLNPKTLGLGEWHFVEPRETVLLEGVYSLRPEFLGCYDFTIWLETPSNICQSRLEARGHITKLQIDSWQATYAWYRKTIRPYEDANIVVDGITGSITKVR